MNYSQRNWPGDLVTRRYNAWLSSYIVTKNEQFVKYSPTKYDFQFSLGLPAIVVANVFATDDDLGVIFLLTASGAGWDPDEGYNVEVRPRDAK